MHLVNFNRRNLNSKLLWVRHNSKTNTTSDNTKYVSKKEMATSSEILAAADKFCLQIRLCDRF